MKRLVAAFAIGVVAAATLGAQQLPPAPKGRTAKDLARPYRPTYESKGEVEVLPVQGSVYLLGGAASNVVVQVGPREIVVVDTAEEAMSDKLLAAIKTISPLPIRYIVDTSADADHVGGNEKFAKSSNDVNVNEFYGQGARIFAHENAYARMTNPKDGTKALPGALWPTDAFEPSLKTMFNGEPIEMIHQPSAHTDGDLMVFFRKSDVVATGDVFSTDRYPVVDAKHGGSLNGVLDGLNRLIDIAVPEFNSMGGTRIIPGHGRICNEIDLVEYRDAMTIIADRITQLILDGRTLEQVKAAGVSLDYDGLYGATTGPWTTEMFVEAVYKEIKGNTAPWKARLMRNVPAAELVAVSSTAKPAPKTAAAKPARKGSGDPWEGEWALNLFKSSYDPSSLMPYRREMEITLNGDQVTHAVSSWRRPQQGNGSPLSTYGYTARLDGKEYPIPNWGNDAKVTLKRVDANTIERTQSGLEIGKEIATWTLSADKKTLTVVAKGTDATGVAYTTTQVYDRRIRSTNAVLH